MTERKTILRKVGEYYAGRLSQHGVTPQGVDWNSAESQSLRFRQLLRVADGANALSINEIGCGYGALVEHLAADGRPFSYCGTDIALAMVNAARSRVGDDSRVQFVAGEEPDVPRDYCLASGIFNVRLETSDAEWRQYLLDTLETLNAFGARGFSFNLLTSYSDIDKMRPDLYYADPLFLFDYCKRRFSRHVALLHDYGLYEFTLLVRKDV